MLRRFAAMGLALVLSGHTAQAAICASACVSTPVAHHVIRHSGMTADHMDHHPMAAGTRLSVIQQRMVQCPPAMDAMVSPVLSTEVEKTAVQIASVTGRSPDILLQSLIAPASNSPVMPDIVPLPCTVLRI